MMTLVTQGLGSAFLVTQGLGSGGSAPDLAADFWEALVAYLKTEWGDTFTGGISLGMGEPGAGYPSCRLYQTSGTSKRTSGKPYIEVLDLQITLFAASNAALGIKGGEQVKAIADAMKDDLDAEEFTLTFQAGYLSGFWRTGPGILRSFEQAKSQRGNVLVYQRTLPCRATISRTRR